MSDKSLKELLTQPTSGLFAQLVRYAFSGGVAFVVDFAVLWFVTSVLGAHYLIGALCGNAVGLVITYLLSIRWIFDKRRFADWKAEFILFVLIGVIGIGLTQLFMYLFTEHVFGAELYLVSKVVTTVIVSLINFTLKKLILFPATRQK